MEITLTKIHLQPQCQIHILSWQVESDPSQQIVKWSSHTSSRWICSLWQTCCSHCNESCVDQCYNSWSLLQELISVTRVNVDQCYKSWTVLPLDHQCYKSWSVLQELISVTRLGTDRGYTTTLLQQPTGDVQSPDTWITF